MHYFSYGSNMSIRRLLARVSSATKIDTGVLERHQLRFHKAGIKDGSAKCDARETGKHEHLIYGVLFKIAEQDKPVLDRYEGLGHGYEEKDVLIRLNNGTVVEAYTYYATNIDPTLKPLDWYREHVVRGARENELPESYIRAIEAIEFFEDTDIERRDRELSIYC
jgi:gamma-glutamylcyclotransferase